MSLQDIKLSMFKDLQSYESKAVSLDTVLWWIKCDLSVQQKTELYRNLAKTITREEANKKVKDSIMPAFSVAVVFNGLGKQTTHATRVTGLSICDIDHVERGKMEEVRCKIWADPHTVLAYTTISGEGFRVIFCYSGVPQKLQKSQKDPADDNISVISDISVGQFTPPENGILYRAAYKKGNQYYADLCGVPYDAQCSDITRLSGIAHDGEAVLNLQAEPFLITDDEAAAANTAADTESGKRRKEDPVGTHHAEVEAAWVVIEQMLAKRNIAYGPGTHHHYVMHATHLFNHFGVERDDVLEWAAQNWCDYEKKQRESIIHWVYRNRQNEHGCWRLNKAGRSKEVTMITLPDIVEWLRKNKVEGIYKTTFFRYLLPPSLRPYYLENSSNSFSQKDDQIALVENCLVEIEEIDMFKDRDNAELKSLSTKVTLKIRRPYDKFVMAKHRLASLCATGNQERFLTDDTGNRRWLCFRVANIDNPRAWDIDYEQLYAQLRDEYYDGFAYWFDKSEEERMTQQNEYFRIVSDEEQLIRCRFRKPKPGEPFKRLNSATIAQMISYGRQPITSRRVSLVMKAIGFKSERNSKGCYYKLYEMDTNESQRVISDMVAEPEIEEKKPEPTQPDLFETSDYLPF